MPSGRAPDFIGLGGGRSGTNWLAACIDEHPHASVPVGEVHFFSRDRFVREGSGQYEAIFSSCPHGDLVGECSSSYWASEEAPARIASLYPDAKLIISLRDPIDRAFSQYRNESGSGRIASDASFLSAFAARPEYRAGSSHGVNLERYLAYIPADRMHIMIFEETHADPERALHDLFLFLGLDPDVPIPSACVRVNESAISRSTAFARAIAWGSGILKRPRLIGLWRFLQASGIASFLKSLNAYPEAPGSRSPSSSDRAALLPIFLSDIGRIETFLGRSLPSWRA